MINRIINKLYLKGAKVYTNASESNVHTSGHARQEELKLLLRLVKPAYFTPMHGEYRMLSSHANLATLCGVPKENTFMPSSSRFREFLSIPSDTNLERKELSDTGFL